MILTGGTFMYDEIRAGLKETTGKFEELRGYL